MGDPASVWQLVLEDLQVSVSQGNFSSFIKPLELFQLTPMEGERIIADINCPSAFHQNIIETRFYSQVQEALNRVAKGKCELRLTVAPSKNATATPAEAGPLFAAQSQQNEDFRWAMQRVGLREDFTFDTFAVSSSNEMAHAAAQAVASSMGSAYNPLFIYGGVGVGKTHLMQAVGIDALKKDSKLKLIYCPGESFTNEIIEAIQQHTTREFRQRYRQVKGLFIDDVQFIAGKNTVQEEFFHTFNAIVNGGGQIVMTCDRPPSEIKMLEARLRSRFEAGLLVDIGNPDFELRSAIVLIKTKQRQLNITMEMAQTIAANIESARQIEGFIVKLITESKIHKRVLSNELVLSLLNKKEAPTEGGANTPPPLRPMEIVKGVADHFGINIKQLRGTGRMQKLVTPRHIAMYLLRMDYRLPLMEVGEIFSGRDHTTVMHAVDKITQQLQESESLRIDVGEVRKRLYH